MPRPDLRHGLTRRILRLAAPIMLANLTQPLMSAVDTGVAGHFPDPAGLGGVAIGTLFFNFVFWGFGFLRMGTTGLVAQAHGAADREGIALAVARALAVASAIAALLLLVRERAIDAALPLLGGSHAVETNARLYCHARIWSMPAALANYVVLGYLLGVQRVRLALLLQVAINLVNIVAVVILVMVEGRGIGAIGAATALADWCGLALAIAAGWALRTRPSVWPSLAAVFDGRALVDLVRMNTHLFLRTICLLAGFGWFARCGAAQGDVVLAANALLLQFQGIMAYGLDGFAHAAEALVGQALGARDRDGVRAVILRSSICAVATAALFSVVYALCGARMVGWLSDQPSVAATATAALGFAVASPLVSVWGFQFDGVFIGATRTRELMWSMLISAAIFLPLAGFASARYGNVGLWSALLAFMALRGITLGALLPRVWRSVR